MGNALAVGLGFSVLPNADRNMARNHFGRDDLLVSLAMAVLFAARNSTGIYSQCDARCYDAEPTKDPACNCICDGKNHGAGLDRAMANTLAGAEEMIRAERNRHRGRRLRFDVIPAPLPFERVS